MSNIDLLASGLGHRGVSNCCGDTHEETGPSFVQHIPKGPLTKEGRKGATIKLRGPLAVPLLTPVLLGGLSEGSLGSAMIFVCR